jgi:membrane protein implicated in regulation of membrane protease activity
VIVDIIHLSAWMKFALVVWVAVSLLAAPLVGRFLAGALHERADKTQRSAAPRIRRGRRQGAASGGVSAPSSPP